MVKFTKEHKSRLEKLATPTLANVLDDIGFEGVMYNLQPAGFGMRVVGEALTVQETTGPFGSFKTEDFKVGHMIEKANPGDVIVVANNGAPVSTWGGMASYSAKLKGIGGVVVDGGIRDREEIIKFEFPDHVFSIINVKCNWLQPSQQSPLAGARLACKLVKKVNVPQHPQPITINATTITTIMSTIIINAIIPNSSSSSTR